MLRPCRSWNLWPFTWGRCPDRVGPENDAHHLTGAKCYLQLIHGTVLCCMYLLFLDFCQTITATTIVFVFLVFAKSITEAELSVCHNMKQTMSHLTQTVKHWQLMPLCGKLLTCSFSVIFCKLARLPAQSHGTLASPACVGFWKLRETAECLPVFMALYLPVPSFFPRSRVIKQMVDRGSQFCMVVMQSCPETRRVNSKT